LRSSRTSGSWIIPRPLVHSAEFESGRWDGMGWDGAGRLRDATCISGLGWVLLLGLHRYSTVQYSTVQYSTVSNAGLVCSHIQPARVSQRNTQTKNNTPTTLEEEDKWHHRYIDKGNQGRTFPILYVNPFLAFAALPAGIPYISAVTSRLLSGVGSMHGRWCRDLGLRMVR